MKRMMLALLMLALLLLSGCTHTSTTETGDRAGEDQFIVVGFSQVGAESDWRNANTKSMLEALSEENGYRLIIHDAQQKQERQITAIRNFIQQEVDYIVLAPTTETGWDTVLAEAKAVGIPVIIVDRMIEVSDPSLFTCWVGSDFLREGQMAVDWMAEHLTGPLKIAHLQGNLGSSAQLGRTNALDNALALHGDWELVFRDNGDFTQAKGQELVEALLASGTEFNVVFSENDNMAYGAINALKGAGIVPGRDVTIISFDANRTALEMLLTGEISYDVECNPLHGPRVRTLIESLAAGIDTPKLTYVDETAFSPESITGEVLGLRGY